MSNNKYSLRYLPIFYDDLNEKVQYIAFEKKNPEAASRLIDAIENATPFSFKGAAFVGAACRCGYRASDLVQ